MEQTITHCNSLSLPGRRREMIQEIQQLMDKENHKNNWCNSSYNHSFWDNFRLYTEVVLEEITMRDRLQDEINLIFRSYNEMVYVHFLIECLQKVIDKIGIEQPDSAYLNSPLWDDVVEAAKHAYEILMKDEDLEALLEAEEKRVVE